MVPPDPGSGLEDQLLGQVVAEERPDLEEAKNQLIISNAKMRQELKDIEDQILYRLSSSEGNPVDDMELIKVLEASKMKAAEIQVGTCLFLPVSGLLPISSTSPGLTTASIHLSAALCLMSSYCMPRRPKSRLQSRPRRTSTSHAWNTYLWLSGPRSSSSVCLTWRMWTPCTSTPSSGSSTSSSRASPTQRGQVTHRHMPILTDRTHMDTFLLWGTHVNSRSLAHPLTSPKNMPADSYPPWDPFTEKTHCPR